MNSEQILQKCLDVRVRGSIFPVRFDTHYSHVLMQAEERDRAKMKDQWERMAVQAAAETGPRTEETCSCIEGNPCVDPYVRLARLRALDRLNCSFYSSF